MRSILFIFSVCVFICACDTASSIYTVMTGSEAIITQNDEIVRGPIEPGLHFKLPFTEKVHEFQMFRVERTQLNFPNTDEYNAIIYWTIQDSKIFFLSTRNKDIQKVILTHLSPKFDELTTDLNIETVANIAIEQTKDVEYTNDTQESILSNLQSSVNDIGVKIYRINYSKLKKEAQHHHSLDSQGRAALVLAYFGVELSSAKSANHTHL